jgi:hypothetical protein
VVHFQHTVALACLCCYTHRIDEGKNHFWHVCVQRVLYSCVQGAFCRILA